MNICFIVILGLMFSSLIIRLGYLGFREYPRTVTFKRGEDAVIFALDLAVAIWFAVTIAKGGAS